MRSRAVPHSRRDRVGRRRRQHAVVGLVVALAVLVPLTAYAAGWRRAAPAVACPARPPVTVQADPRIAPVVSALLRDIGPGPECVPVQVDQRSSADLAYDLTRPPGADFPVPLPDIWIPDSSAWLALVGETSQGVKRVSALAPLSMAVSPVVAAVRRDTARGLGWPQRQTGWDALLAADGGGLKVAVTNAQTDGPGLLTSVAQQQGVDVPSPQLLRLTRRAVLPRFDDFRGQSPASAVANGLFDAVSASEQDVVAHNRDQPDHPLVAEYDPRGVAPLDFPLVPIADAESGEIAAGRQTDDDVVQARLVSPAAVRALTQAGFRTAAGTMGGGLGTDQGVVAAPGPALGRLAASTARQVQRHWASLSRRGRVLVVVDESGSMGDRLPGSPLSKMELAKQALGAVVREVAPDSDMGLWTFTSSPGRDYQVRVPLGRLDAPVGGRPRRAVLGDAVAALTPDATGGTGLYDTTLAAFRAAAEDYRFGRLNAILIFTDGRNEDDPGSIGLDALLRSIGSGFEASQPVRVLTFAYGKDADTATLATISARTGGQAYRAVRPDQVAPLLTRALAQL